MGFVYAHCAPWPEVVRASFDGQAFRESALIPWSMQALIGLPFPILVAVAILRYGAFDFDVVVRRSLVTNRVGNFFSPEPLPAGRFDVELVQGGALVGRMSSGEADTSAPLSCNGCHEHRGGARLGFGD